MEKKINWVKIADTATEIQWQNNQMSIIEVEGKKITLVKFNSTIYAIAHKCPHASGIMADGFIDALGNIVCPLHRYKFSLENGRNTSGEGYYLKTYPVLTNDEGVFLGITQNIWGFS
jgi:3-phenylpropionate/trans-cinnamate dioxygenase ferredoxin subunit